MALELILFSIRSEIEENRFLLRQHPMERPQLRNRLCFFFGSFSLFFDLALVRLAGILTNWGQSLARAFVLLLGIILVFGWSYVAFFEEPWRHALFRALDVSLVAGYDVHIGENDVSALRVVTFINLIFGIYWYSLIVPVITRKFLR